MFDDGDAWGGPFDGALDARAAPGAPAVPGPGPVGTGWGWDAAGGQAWSAGEPWTLHAAELAAMPPSSDLAHLLDRGSLAQADDDALIEAVAAWRRIGSWAAAGAARAAAELASRPAMNPAWPASAGSVAVLDVAGDELAMALACSRRAARTLVRDGLAFAGALAPTGDALARGAIDPPRASILVRALEDVPVPLALDVQDAVLPSATGRTPTQLAQDVARALIVADPAGASTRHEVAVRGRRVERPRCAPDGMATWWALLPAADAVRLDSTLDGLARAARQLGDPRTLDQLRADVLVELGTGGLTGRVDRTEASGVPDGLGEVWDPEGQEGDGREGVGQEGDGQRERDGRSWRRGSRRSEIRVTVPLTTLMGLRDEPGELAGYGPVTAAVARELAQEAPWRRIVTDPLSGAVLDVGRSVYRPPAAIADHVRARDQRCARPGCSTAAESCDLDHTVEFGRAGGITADVNLGPLCPRDHAIKTDGGFALEQVTPGVFEWTTPGGRRYRVTPGAQGRVEGLPSRGRRGLGPRAVGWGGVGSGGVGPRAVGSGGVGPRAAGPGGDWSPGVGPPPF